MNSDVMLVRIRDGYRVLFGCLHLVNLLDIEGEAEAQICGGEKVKIFKTETGVLVDADNLPVYFSEH